MQGKASEKNMQFLAGGGEMGALTRSYDWSQTPLGTTDLWPQSLRTTLSIILHSKFPMFLFWGADSICFYNDAYRPSLGNSGKHPYALGKNGAEIWPEIWADIKPLIDQVMGGGEATWSEDQLLPIYRNGKLEDVYWTFSYSPVSDESGQPAGVFVTCTETTEKVNTLKKLENSNRRYLNNILQAPVAMCIFRGKNHNLEIANELMLGIWGKTAAQVINKPIFEGLPEAKGQGLEALLDNVYSTGEKFTANEHPVSLLRNGVIESTYINFVYEALKESDGIISGIVATASEVTSAVVARQKMAESEQKLRTLVETVPFPIAVYTGEEMRIELANQAIMDIWGKGNDVIGKLFTDVLSELDSQQVFEQIREVYRTGVPFHTRNQRLDLIVDGKSQPYYFNYSLTPLTDTSGKVYAVMNTGVDLTDLSMAKLRIEESEARFRNNVKQAPIGITIFRGPDFVVELANDTYLQLVDRKEADFLGRPLFDSLPEVQEIVEPLLTKVFTTGEPFYASEFPVTLHRYGRQELTYFNLAYQPLREEDGDITGIMVVATEVTESVMAKQKIEQSEQQVRTMVDSAPYPIGVYIGREMRIEFANQTIRDIWGKGNDVIGKKYADVLPELKGQGIYEQLEQVYNTGVEFINNNQALDLIVNGVKQTFYFNYTFTPLRDITGRVYGVMNTAVDVTYQVDAHEKLSEINKILSESEQFNRSMTERYQLALQAGELGSYELDIESGYIECTAQCKKNYGLGPDAVLTYDKLLSYILPEDRDHMQTGVQESLKTGVVYNTQYRVYWPDGSIHWVQVAGLPYYDETGKAIKMTGVSSEITKQKLFEEELAKQVKERTAQLEQKNIALENMNVELKSFAYVSSHDLQEPLRKIQTYANRIAEEEKANLSERGNNYFTKIQDSATRMRRLIEDLLAYSRINNSDLVFEPADFRDIINEVIQELHDSLHEKQATILFHESCEATIIPFQFKQLFINLISNSLKFSIPAVSPLIEIWCKVKKGDVLQNPALSPDKEYCEITFRDNGIGFEPEYKDKVFELFQRLHHKDKYEGTGIGLAIVKKIVETHNGVITVTSEVNKGVKFDIYIPLTSAD